MITEPKVLFLDEPTTGLDSYTANETMKVVKKMAIDGTTVCSTIHSPTSFTFSLFNQAMFLLGGKLVFFGERGKTHFSCFLFWVLCPEAAVGFFKNFSTGIDPKLFDNDADYLTATIVDAERSNRGDAISEVYGKSELQRTTTRDLHQLLEDEDFTVREMLDDRDIKKHFVNVPFWFAFKTLLQVNSVPLLSTLMICLFYSIEV